MNKYLLPLVLLATGVPSFAQDDEVQTLTREEILAGAKSATVDNPYDLTSLIVNPNFDNDSRDGWEGTGATAVTWGTWEHWNHSFDNYQLIGTDLPNGVYLISASALHRVGNYYDAHYSTGKLSNDSLLTAVLYGKSGKVDLANPIIDLMTCQTTEPASEYGTAQISNGNYIPDNPESFYYYTLGGYYADNSVYVAVVDSSLTIGWRDPADTYIASSWTITDNWKLQYLGNSDDAYQLIVEQQTPRMKDYSDVKANEQLLNAYNEAREAFRGATSSTEMLQAYADVDSLSKAIDANLLAYKNYKAKYNEILNLMLNNDIYGPDRDVLESYLQDYEEPGDQYPNGTYQYIVDVMPLNTEQITAETAYMQQLYQTAVENGIGDGTNITNLVTNADFTQSNFAGWDYTRSNTGNFYSRTGAKGDGWQSYSSLWCGEAWNCSFDFHQTIDKQLPNGIYELTMNALYRPGTNQYFPAELLPIEVYMNDYTTPVQHIISDALPADQVQNHVNCWIDNVGTWPQDDKCDYGYVPNSSHGSSIAFNGGRYKQTVYGLVTDGKLTLGMRHTRRPYYDNDWCTWANWQLVYRAQNADAVNGALANMKARADMLSQVTEKHFCKDHITTLTEAIAKAEAADNTGKFEQLPVINQLIQEVYGSMDVYDSLNTALEYMSEMAFSGSVLIDDKKTDELYNAYTEYMDQLESNAFTDQQARQLIKDIYSDPVFDVIYTYGDMTDGDWEQSCFLYPLTKQSDGHYRGTIKIQDRSEGWGGRASFFFVYQGTRLGRQEGSLDRFFTPAHNSKKMGLLSNKDDDCFNTTGGDWDVDINLDSMTIEMNPVDQMLWPANVYLAGTLPGGYWQRNDAYPLASIGDGLYQGIVTLEDFDNGNAGVTLFACREPYDWTHARYGNSGYTNNVVVGNVYDDLNRYRGDTKWLVPVGTYKITFDMNKERIQFNNPEDEDGIEGLAPTLSEGEGVIYNLAGQRISKPQKGVNIINGKKIIY